MSPTQCFHHKRKQIFSFCYIHSSPGTCCALRHGAAIHSSLGWEIACGPKAGAASGQWSLAVGTSLWSITSRVGKMQLGAVKHCIEVSQCLSGKLSQHLSTQSFRGRTGKDILSFTNKCTFPQLKCRGQFVSYRVIFSIETSHLL